MAVSEHQPRPAQAAARVRSRRRALTRSRRRLLLLLLLLRRHACVLRADRATRLVVTVYVHRK
eukprot:5360127-Prymnesium_polylepis.1